MKFLPLFAILALLPSCTAVVSGIFNEPIPTTPVQRVGGSVPFNVATRDVVRAETEPNKIWGLYNAGAVADAAGQAVDSGK